MMKKLLSSTVCAALLLPLTLAVDPLVHLNYTSYRGTALPNGVTQWLGLRYAAPPLGNLRFAGPQPPLPTYNGTVNAYAHGPYCLGTASGPPTFATAEDCLFMGMCISSFYCGEAELTSSRHLRS